MLGCTVVSSFQGSVHGACFYQSNILHCLSNKSKVVLFPLAHANQCLSCKHAYFCGTFSWEYCSIIVCYRAVTQLFVNCYRAVTQWFVKQDLLRTSVCYRAVTQWFVVYSIKFHSISTSVCYRAVNIYTRKQASFSSSSSSYPFIHPHVVCKRAQHIVIAGN